jgi:hypothetical protein
MLGQVRPRIGNKVINRNLDWFTGPKLLAASIKSPALSTILRAIELDPLTVADDPNYLTRIDSEPNVPAPIRAGLRALY